MSETKLKCLIVDDEDLAVSLLEAYARQTMGLEVAGTCYHALDAQQFLLSHQVDVIFLDIQMPYLTGLELVRKMKNPPLIVFTTSYSEHAVEAFELNVIDYLLKPFTYERFLQAVQKVKDYLYAKNRREEADYFFVKSNSMQVKIMYDEVLYIEGLKQYVKIVTTSRQVITLESMKKLEEELPAGIFIRIHKSYIVAVNKIDAMGRKEVGIGKKQIPVGKTYEEGWLKRMDSV